MNATFTRRLFAITGLSAIGGALIGMLPFSRRSKRSEPDIAHLLDEPKPVTEPVRFESKDLTTGGKVLSHEQEAVREWYRKEFEIEPVYDEHGTITKFVNVEGTPESEFSPDDVRRYVEEVASIGDVTNLPIPAGVEGAGPHPEALGVGAPTEVTIPTLH